VQRASHEMDETVSRNCRFRGVRDGKVEIFGEIAEVVRWSEPGGADEGRALERVDRRGGGKVVGIRVVGRAGALSKR
jgi:hypothetical protein